MTPRQITKMENDMMIVSVMISSAISEKQDQELMIQILLNTTEVLHKAALKYELYEACEVLKGITKMINDNE